IEKNCEIKKRGIEVSLFLVVPISSRMRLVLDSPSNTSLSRIFEMILDRQGTTSEAILHEYLQVKADCEGGNKAATEKENVLDEFLAFEKICKAHVPQNLLHNYFSEECMDFGVFWLFRMQFTFQYAIFAALSYIFQVGQRMPGKIIVNQDFASVL